MKFFRKSGFIDKTDNKRIGLLFVRVGYNISSITVTNKENTYDVILEVREIYCDKQLSKIEAVYIPFNTSEYTNYRISRSKYLPIWIDSKKIYWISPPTDVDRDQKLSEILK